MKRAQSQALRLIFVLLMSGASAGAVIAETYRSMLDGDVVAVEAGYVELVVGASGDVVQVRVEDCETCKQVSYLPSRNLIISRKGQPVDVKWLAGFNKKPGTLVLSVDSELVQKVNFWVPRGEKEGDQ